MARPARPPSALVFPLVVLLTMSVLAPAARPDTLLLKSGERVEGEIRDQGDTYEVRTKYGTLSVRKEEVAKVVRPADLATEAGVLRRTAETLLEEAQKPEAKPEERLAKRAAAEETLKKALALYQDARSVTSAGAAADLDQAIAAVTRAIAACREIPKPATLAPVAPPKAAEPASTTPPPAAPAAKPKAPEPDAAAQKAAETALHDLFKAEYARRTPADQQALAARFIREAGETRDDPVSQFVLLREARDLAAQSADLATALAAIDRMGALFAVDALALKGAVLTAAARSPKTPDAAVQIARACLALADEAEEADQYDTAVSLASKAESAARQAQDPALAAEAQSRRKDAESLRTDYQAVKDAAKTLKENPDDPASSLAVGKFLCLSKGDWNGGLPLLARGSDPALQALAEKELAAPSKPEAMAALGDGWWDAAAARSGAVKSRLLARALHWYEKALPGSTGLSKARIAGRIESAARTDPGGEIPRAGLAFWVEPGMSPGAPFRDLRSGLAGENKGATLSTAGTPAIALAAGTMIVYPVTPATASVTRTGSIFAWFKTDDVTQFGCVVNRCENRNEGPEDFGFYIHGGHVQTYFNWALPDVAPVGSSTGALTSGKWTLGGITWDENALTFFIDGKKDNTIPLKKGPPLLRGSKVVIGVSIPGGPGGIEYYQGLLGSLMIYNRALPEAEIQRLHAGTARKFR